MLRELSVRNLALIADARVELSAGFCAWTGETGAGKTLLLSALGLLLGERADADLIRADAEELRITGLFELRHADVREAVAQILDESLEEDSLTLARRLNRSGRSSAYVNESPVSIGTLRKLGRLLVGVHGQRESHDLLEPAYQLQLLDAFGNLSIQRRTYQIAAEELRELRRRQSSLKFDRQQRERELSLIRFERTELDDAEFQPDEIEELTQERDRLQHAQSLITFAETGCAQLYDQEGAVFEQFGKLLRDAEKWAAVEPRLADVQQRLASLSSETQDVAETLRDLAGSWQADPQRQEQVEDRLQLLHKLEAKYNLTLRELVDYRADLDRREKELQGQEDDLASIESSLAQAWKALRSAGAHLTAKRKKIAKRMASLVQKQLADLGMKDAKLNASLEPIYLDDDAEEIPVHGLDRFELLITPNKGEPERPLRKIASGGELSRTMLALKSVLAAQDHLGTLVFDEIDANVGGRLGDVLGRKLATLAKTHQVICVTHLPQVASYADRQWTIRKQRKGRRTFTVIESLADADRLDELASMLRGDAKGETTRREADAMLTAAKEFAATNGK